MILMDDDTPVVIGIDPGTITGLAIWQAGPRAFKAVDSMPIHAALQAVLDESTAPLLVIFEDARMNRRSRDATSGPRQQGYGSVKRDCVIWQDFLEDHRIAHLRVRARKKLDAATFTKVTGWKGSTNSHARDAAMLVHGYPATIASRLIREKQGKA